jgi:hypothetical protein
VTQVIVAKEAGLGMDDSDSPGRREQAAIAMGLTRLRVVLVCSLYGALSILAGNRSVVTLNDQPALVGRQPR